MKSKRSRRVVVIIFFLFMLLHQTDKLLINPLAAQIYSEWNLTDTQWGAISTAALIVGAVFYPLWGYLYDRYARSKLIALASLIWGATTWLSAIAPSYNLFLASRATTGIDDSSYPGIYSLIADYFSPNMRGKIYGLLQLSMPLGYMTGLILATTVAASIGWRNIFVITGGLGIFLAVLIFIFVKDIKRGSSEPELESVDDTEKYKFEWKKVKDVFKNRSMIYMYLQGFFGMFPWNTISAFIFIYLSEERGYQDTDVLLTMAPAILVLASGYYIGGALGDHFFQKTKKGRILVALTGVITGAILLTITLNIPQQNQLLFGIALALTALFIPLSSPNVTSTVNDVTVPEIRSTAIAIQYFIESSGAALAPLATGMISDYLRSNNVMNPLGTSILIISVSTWFLCAVIYFLTTKVITQDIENMQTELKARASGEI